MPSSLIHRLFLIMVFVLAAPVLRGDDLKSLSLVQLVDADAGLVLRIQDFQRNAPTFLESRWLQSFRGSPLYRKLCDSSDVRKIVRAGKQIEEVSGRPLFSYLSTIFGEDVIVALFPDEAGTPYGVLYTAAESELALQQSIARWKRLEPQSTLLFKHQGLEYAVRYPQRDQGASHGLYYCALGRYFVLSDREEAIKTAIDLHQAVNSEAESAELKSLADVVPYTVGREKLPSVYWISCYFCPSQWKRALGHLREKTSEDPELKFLNFFLNHSDAMMLGLRFEEGFFSRLLVKPDDSAKTWVTLLSGNVDSEVPLKPIGLPCIAAIRMQFPAGAVAPFLTQFLERKVPHWENLRQVLNGIFLGHDPITEILPRLGPDLQLSLHPRVSTESHHDLPAELVASISIQPGELDSPAGKSSLNAVLSNGIHSLLHLLAIGEADKQNPVKITRETENLQTLWSIQHETETVAAIALDEGSLRISSTKKLVSDSPEETLNGSALFKDSLAGDSSRAANFLWVHLPSVTTFLEGDSDADELREFVRLFDVFWATLDVDQGIIQVDAVIQKLPEPVQP